MNKKIQVNTNGDDTMSTMTLNSLELNLESITKRGTVISSHEALEDTVPISWEQDVLKGKRKVIIKSKEDNGDENV